MGERLKLVNVAFVSSQAFYLPEQDSVEEEEQCFEEKSSRHCCRVSFLSFVYVVFMVFEFRIGSCLYRDHVTELPLELGVNT